MIVAFRGGSLRDRHWAGVPVSPRFRRSARRVTVQAKRGAGGGSRTLTGLLSPADFLTVYGFRRPD